MARPRLLNACHNRAGTTWAVATKVALRYTGCFHKTQVPILTGDGGTCNHKKHLGHLKPRTSDHLTSFQTAFRVAGGGGDRGPSDKGVEGQGMEPFQTGLD